MKGYVCVSKIGSIIESYVTYKQTSLEYTLF
jgi:hypothetical protein